MVIVNFEVTGGRQRKQWEDNIKSGLALNGIYYCGEPRRVEEVGCKISSGAPNGQPDYGVG